MNHDNYKQVTMDKKKAAEDVMPLVEERNEAKDKVKELEATIAQLKAKIKDLEESQIPDTLLESGFPEGVFLPNGGMVQVKPFYFARVNKENPQPFYHWLRENGHGGLVKSHFEQWLVDARAVQLLKELFQHFKINYDLSEGIHWKQLESWFREQSEKNTELPTDLFENFIGRRAYIK